MSKVKCTNCNEYLEKCSCGETEVLSEDGAVCPHCGFVDDDLEDYFYDEAHHENECPNCSEEYNIGATVYFIWTTTEIKKGE